ncbi:MAG: tetratricopeptide repeat protein [Scytolyngbya sp. HA4215-MV1]|jgi:putative thioredoxin|nr:tetratricopeptide repeat protein [Scytolyngbya sp. HA4215-MV1]
MGVTIAIENDDFQTEVLEKSYEKPVLIDFYATWCGPCQLLKPVLEKLVQEYDVVLAKIDIDENPELANAYGVQGVPDVRIASQGDVLEGFVGVLPEHQIRDLLDRLHLKSDLDAGLDQIQKAIAAGALEQAKDLFGQLLEKYPQNSKLLIEAAKFLVRVNQFEAVEQLLAPIQAYDKEYFMAAKAVKALVELKKEISQSTVETDLDEAYLKACRLTLAANYENALQHFLEIVGRDRRYRNDGARKAMLTIFDLLGDDHPLTRSYRKQLTMALY